MIIEFIKSFYLSLQITRQLWYVKKNGILKLMQTKILSWYFTSTTYVGTEFNESRFSKNNFIFPTRSIAFRLDLSDTIKMMDVDYLNKHLRYYTLKANKHIFSFSPIRFYLRSKGINDPKNILKCVNKKCMIRVVVWGNHLLM